MKQVKSMKNFLNLFRKIPKRIRRKIRGSEFVYDVIDLLHYRLHKISLNRGGLYVDSLEWLKIRKQQ